MKLKNFYKLYSVWVFVLVTLLPLVEEHWSYFSSIVPEKYHPYVMAGLGVLGVLARLVRQPTLENDND